LDFGIQILASRFPHLERWGKGILEFRFWPLVFPTLKGGVREFCK